jgi:hypothetical protein
MEASFQASERRIQEHYGFHLPLSAVASTTRRHAEAIAKQQDQREGAHKLPEKGVETLIAQADGCFMRIVSTSEKKTDRRKTRSVDFNEVRLCAASAQGSSKTYYDATFEQVRKIAGIWSFAAKDAGMGLETKVHVVADGAPWIQIEGRSAFGKQGTFLIDLYHVLEYLHKAAPACSATPERWLRTQKKRLKTGHAPKVIAELKKHMEPETMMDADAPVRCAWRYLNNRPDSLAYDVALKEGLPIGSGQIESANKHVLQARLKIPGAAWNIRTAEHFAQTRALRANDQWDQYWKSLQKSAA